MHSPTKVNTNKYKFHALARGVQMAEQLRAYISQHKLFTEMLDLECVSRCRGMMA